MSPERKPTVFVIDDDPAVLDSLVELLESVAHTVAAYTSAAAFLDDFDPKQPGCLVLDVRMPGMSGLDLQVELVRRKALLPIIFITGHGDVPMAVRAMKHGAVEFIQKPLRDQDLLEHIERALADNLAHYRDQKEQHGIQARLHTLTPREREVLDRMVTGKTNKITAHELGISQRTVEIHRAAVMEKMQVRTLAELVDLMLRQHH